MDKTIINISLFNISIFTFRIDHIDIIFNKINTLVNVLNSSIYRISFLLSKQKAKGKQVMNLQLYLDNYHIVSYNIKFIKLL